MPSQKRNRSACFLSTRTLPQSRITPFLRLSKQGSNLLLPYDGGMNARPDIRVPFDRPAIYQISVEGSVPENWLDRFEGMTLTHIEEFSNPPLCTLTGRLEDQVALASVLKVLHELHVTVLSVSRFEIPPEVSH